MLLATHDRDTIARIGQRVLTLGQGKLLDDRRLEPGEPLPSPPPTLETEAAA